MPTARPRRRSARCCRPHCCRRCCCRLARQGDARAAVGGGAAGLLFIGFGLDLDDRRRAVPVASLPWKRLLAYSSLEHMGVIALGIGFGSPLAIAGVVDPRRRARARQGARVLRRAAAAARGPDAAPAGAGERAEHSPPTAAAMGISLAALAGLPPSPLFRLGAADRARRARRRRDGLTAMAVVALALGFLGLLHALIEGVIGESPPSPTPPGAAAASARSWRSRHLWDRVARAHCRGRRAAPRLELRRDLDERGAVTACTAVEPGEWRRSIERASRRRRALRAERGHARTPGLRWRAR